MKDGEIRTSLINLAQAMTTKAQVVTTNTQSVVAQANWEVEPRVNKFTTTMSSRLRDNNSMNATLFLLSMVNEDPQDILD